MNKYWVEFLGTALLVFIILTTKNAILIGATLALCVLVGGAISGGAFNPAVAVAMMYNGSLSRDDLVSYVFVQLAGALLAVYAARAL